MKLSRRCFLSFAIGGAAGTALTPLPWKLTDDLSIWSQNWPWTPVPPDGTAHYVDTTCTLCPGHCGIRVRKVDDRAIKIEGQEDTLANSGGICLLGLSGLQLLYGPTRVTSPLKRVGDRGQGQWQTITWQEAIGEVVAKLAEIRDKGTPQSVAALLPDDKGTVAQLMKRLLTAYGSPNFMTMPSSDDAASAALRLTQGVAGAVGVDVENCDFILSFGSALLDGYGATPRMMQAVNHLKSEQVNGKLVQVEPRLSNTAAKANQWLPANPGTEADLALAMAYVIIENGKYNSNFVTNYTVGFEAFTEMLSRSYTPQAVAQTTGIDAATIEKTALAFADAQHPLALYGRGKGQTPGSLKEALAVSALNALVGNLNQQGGMMAVPDFNYIQWLDAELDTVAAQGLKTERIDSAGPYAEALPHRMIDAVQNGKADLQALLIAECNPGYSLPGSSAVKAALSKIPFVVSFSSFLDETAMQADLVLPNHIYLERFEDVPVIAGTGQPVIGLCRPVVAPLYKTQHLGDSIIQIAKGLKGTIAQAFPWTDYQSCLQQTLADTWAALIKAGSVAAGNTAVSSWDFGFTTPSGKYAMMNDDQVAIYQAEAAAPQGDKTQFPLQLIAYDSIRLASRYVGDTPFMLKVVPDTMLKGSEGFVDINPETAAGLGLKEGDSATLTTPVGTAKVRVHLDDGIMPALLGMARGLGHEADNAFLANRGVNTNSVIGPMEDPASGLDAVWGIRAKLTRV